MSKKPLNDFIQIKWPEEEHSSGLVSVIYGSVQEAEVVSVSDGSESKLKPGDKVGVHKESVIDVSDESCFIRMDDIVYKED